MWSVWQTCRTGRRVAGFLGGLLVALLLAAAPAMAQVEFTVIPEPLSNGGEGITPAVAVTSSGQVYVVWREGDDIWFNRSVEKAGSCGGAAALEFPRDPAQKLPRNLSNVPKNVSGQPTQVSADSPSIAANDRGGVFVVWRDKALAGTTTGVVTSIKFARSIDGGVTFADPQPLQFPDVKFPNPTFPAIAADKGDNSGGVFAAWQDTVAGKSAVLMAQSLDGGAPGTFTYGNVTANRPPSRRASVASDGSMVHVVWQESPASKTVTVWYKGFVQGPGLSTVGAAVATELTSGPVADPAHPKIAAHTSGVTAAWFQASTIGTSIIARTKLSGGTSFGSAEPMYSYPSAMSLSNLSLSFGGAGRFFAWQEGGSSMRYLLGTGTGILPSSPSATNPAAPSVGQDGTDRLVASWQETGTTTEVKFAYTGGSGSGASTLARVWAEPRVLNYRTVGRGMGLQPNYTVYIELPPTEEYPKGAAPTIDPGSVRLKVQGKDPGYAPLLSPSALGDHDGNGIMDLMVKFNRSIFDGAGTAVAAQSTGTYYVNYTVTGETSGSSKGCFKSSDPDPVQIMR